jgi:hypothetical protein
MIDSTTAGHYVYTTKTWDIIVKDRGPGIPPESLESVFRPYYRLDKARSRNRGRCWAWTHRCTGFCTQKGWQRVDSSRIPWTLKRTKLHLFQRLTNLHGTPWNSAEVQLERETRLELATSTLARLRSTN